MNNMIKKFDFDTTHRMQAIFSSIFIIQNRMQTAGEKIQTEISMKQWLLIAMTSSYEGETTLTNIGNLMGCSRQNIKKLATALEKKGYLELVKGYNNSINIKLNDKVNKYFFNMSDRHSKTLEKLFSEFSEKEIKTLFSLYLKLYRGIEKVEKYAEEIRYDE